MNSRLVTAALYTLETPIGVWAGIALDKSQWLLGCVLTCVLMVLVFLGVCLWFDTQTKEINNSE